MLRDEKAMSDSDVRLNSLKDVLNIIDTHPILIATQILEQCFKNAGDFKRVLDDPAFQWNDFDKILETTTNLSNDCRDRFKYLFMLKSMLNEDENSLAHHVEEAYQMLEHLQEGQFNYQIQIANHDLLIKNHFTPLTATLAYQIIEDKSELLDPQNEGMLSMLIPCLREIIAFSLSLVQNDAVNTLAHHEVSTDEPLPTARIFQLKQYQASYKNALDQIDDTKKMAEDASIDNAEQNNIKANYKEMKKGKMKLAKSSHSFFNHSNDVTELSEEVQLQIALRNSKIEMHISDLGIDAGEKESDYKPSHYTP